MNDFTAHMDVFYELRSEYLSRENYEAALAMDTVIDFFDGLMKGKSWSDGIGDFERALKSNMGRGILSPAELEAYEMALSLL